MCAPVRFVARVPHKPATRKQKARRKWPSKNSSCSMFANYPTRRSVKLTNISAIHHQMQTVRTAAGTDVSFVVSLNRTHHPPINLQIIAHLKGVLADAHEVPFVIKGLGAQILFPNP